MWNYQTAMLLNHYTHPQAPRTDNEPRFIRADMVKNIPGHTFMTADRMEGVLSRAGYARHHIAGLLELVELAQDLKLGTKDYVVEIPAACPYLIKMGEFLKQLYTENRKTLDGEEAAIRKVHTLYSFYVVAYLFEW